MRPRVNPACRNAAAAALLLVLTPSCSLMPPKVVVHDLAGLSGEDRKVLTASARSDEASDLKRLREDERSDGAPWSRRYLWLTIKREGPWIQVNGLYEHGEKFLGGPRFDAKKTKDGWKFFGPVINPC